MKGFNIGEPTITNLIYADDIIFVVKSAEKLQVLFDVVSKASRNNCF